MSERKDSQVSEQELIDGCKRGDRTAQRRLYDRYAPIMLALCSRYTGSRDTAQDVLIEGFLTIFEKIGTYRAQGSFEGWMRRIFINESLMYIRKNDVLKYADEIENVPETGLGFESHGVVEKMNADQLMELIMEMPIGFRSIFNLYVIEGYSHQEIAEALGITEGSSRSQLSRGRVWLQERIKKL